MKKIALLASGLTYFLSFGPALAQTPVGVKIASPLQGVNPSTAVGTLISNALTLIFVIAALMVLVMLVWGALSWIMSGGDKEAVGKARGRITHALIGLAILALAFLITRVVGQIVNIDILHLESLPTLSQCSGINQVFDPSSGACVTPIPTQKPS